jgi:AAA domain
MPTLANHQSSRFTKLLLIGNSGTGKTGSLASLVKDGYKLRILDFDNGLDSLAAAVRRSCPDKLGQISFVTLRDKRKATPIGAVIDGPPIAFVRSLQLLDHWKDGDVDLGVPSKWGPECVLVVDSLTFMADAAWDFREPLVPRGTGGKYDVRAVYKDAQDAVSATLGLLTNSSFETNVIVIAHVQYMTLQDGTMKGFPTAVGSALGPQIPRYFNTVALCETTPSGKRTIRTVPTALIDLKNPKPFDPGMVASFDIEDGMAKFFKVLRG